MTLYIHLQIVGALLMLLGLSHIFFDRFFGWEQELAAVSLLTRRVFIVRSKAPHPMNREEMKARRKWNSGSEWH
jgi:hypothetical protein